MWSLPLCVLCQAKREREREREKERQRMVIQSICIVKRCCCSSCWTLPFPAGLLCVFLLQGSLERDSVCILRAPPSLCRSTLSSFQTFPGLDLFVKSRVDTRIRNALTVCLQQQQWGTCVYFRSFRRFFFFLFFSFPLFSLYPKQSSTHGGARLANSPRLVPVFFSPKSLLMARRKRRPSFRCCCRLCGRCCCWCSGQSLIRTIRMSFNNKKKK